MALEKLGDDGASAVEVKKATTTPVSYVGSRSGGGGVGSLGHAARADTRAHSQDKRAAVVPRPAETVDQSIDRMFGEGWSGAQIATQLRRWHPTWSQEQIARAMMRAPKPERPLPASPQAGATDDRVVVRPKRGALRPPMHAHRVAHHGAVLQVVRSALSEAESVVKDAKRASIDVAAVRPYAEYYVAYEFARILNREGRRAGFAGSLLTHALALPAAAIEIQGLLGDAAFDRLKHERIRDEGFQGGHSGYLNPLHSFLPSRLGGPQLAFLPGVRPGAIDFEW